ncbi:MAG: RNA 2',3'-cyclic phosphodiesterase [Blastocatellales bacterium]|nr:RNA 2',3'-cyclic phosphodiesterase [Blastocatellales bacterium]
MSFKIVSKEEIRTLQESLEKDRASIAWTPSDNLHLTLKFLGEINDGAVQGVAEIVQNAVTPRRALKLGLAGAGVFPDARNPRILWIGLNGQIMELVNLAGVIDADLARAGYPAESRVYNPHLTIGRFKSPVGARDVIDLAKRYCPPADLFEIREVIVMRSILQRGGSRYIPLHRIPLLITD